MLDIKLIRENSEIVKQNLIRKKDNEKLRWVDELIELDKQWRQIKFDVQKVMHQKNDISKQINQLKKENQDIQPLLNKLKQIPETIQIYETKLESLKEKIDYYLKNLPNILHESVPEGENDSNNKSIREIGEIPKFDFPIKNHIEIAEDLNLIDLETARTNSGARFFYLKNDAVLLDLALQKFAIDKLLKEGFELVQPPFMLNKAALEGGVNISEFKDTIYKIEDEDLYLIGTSEHPLVSIYRNKTLEENQLPIKICGISTCFRKELGSHGIDDKGIFRVHQFNKIEQVVYSTPEESYKYFDYMQNLSETLFQELKIPYRVVQICTGDIGNKQSLQYDIEGWFPGQDDKKGRYRELTSCSNCTDYQAVTLNTKYKNKEGNKNYVHMLNNTAIATARTIAAILENFQQQDGSVKIPEVLVPYMGGKEYIKRNK